jgi:hypothetical protein
MELIPPIMPSCEPTAALALICGQSRQALCKLDCRLTHPPEKSPELRPQWQQLDHLSCGRCHIRKRVGPTYAQYRHRPTDHIESTPGGVTSTTLSTSLTTQVPNMKVLSISFIGCGSASGCATSTTTGGFGSVATANGISTFSIYSQDVPTATSVSATTVTPFPVA